MLNLRRQEVQEDIPNEWVVLRAIKSHPFTDMKPHLGELHSHDFENVLHMREELF